MGLSYEKHMINPSPVSEDFNLFTSGFKLGADTLRIIPAGIERVLRREDDGKALAKMGETSQNVMQCVERLAVPLLPEHFAAKLPIERRAVSAAGKIERNGGMQRGEQTEAAHEDILPRCLKIARIPRVGNGGTGAACVFEQGVQLSGWVAAKAAGHVCHVFPVHAEEKVKVLIVLRTDAARKLA